MHAFHGNFWRHFLIIQGKSQELQSLMGWFFHFTLLRVEVEFDSALTIVHTAS